MGVDFADYDNDGWPDAFVNALAINGTAIPKNKGSFDDVSDSVGISEIPAAFRMGTKIDRLRQ